MNSPARGETRAVGGAERSVAPAATDDLVRLQAEDFTLDELAAAVRGPDAGGIVTFLGTVRDTSDAGTVQRLEFESYGPMAERTMRELAAAARLRFGVRRVALVHRTGTLSVGDRVVGIAVAGAHRAEAFAACAWIIEDLKRVVPIWKKEITARGGRWVETVTQHP